MKKLSSTIILSLFLCSLAVLAIPMTGEAAKAKLNKKNMTMVVGQQRQLKVKNTDKAIKWKSSKKKVAKVNNAGLVTAKKEGTAVITAKFGKKKLSSKVLVKDKPTLEDNRVNICIGKKQKLVVSGTAKNVTWKSSDRKVVKISQKGVITGLKKGQAIITAKVGKKELTCKVKVKAAIRKPDSVYKVENGDWMELIYYSDSITYTVEDESIARVYFYTQGYDYEYRANVADVYMYGIKDGETTVTITNNCNKESVKFKVVVKKPKTESKEQQLIDYVISNGSFEELGEMYVTDGFARIYYSGLENVVEFSYRAEIDGKKVEWYIMEDVADAKKAYFVMWILESNTPDDYVTAHIEMSTYKGEERVYEDAWFGTPAKEQWQGLANKATRQALSGISALLKEAGLELSDIGFCSYNV